MTGPCLRVIINTNLQCSENIQHKGGVALGQKINNKTEVDKNKNVDENVQQD